MGRDARTGSPSELTRAALAALRPQRSEAHLGRGSGRGAARTGRANPNQLQINPGPQKALARGCARTLVAAHRERFGSRCGRRSLRRPAAHALGPLRAPHVEGPAGAARRPTPIPSSTAASRTASACSADDELDRLVGRLRARAGAARPRRRLPLRGREALPRLPRPRAAQRARTRPGATAAASRTARASCASVVDGHPRRGARASGSACASPSSTPCPAARAPSGRGRRRSERGGLPLAFGLLEGEDLDAAPRRRARAAARARGAGRALDLHHARAAPTTTPTCSGPRSSPLPTATCRPRIRCAAWPARSRPPRASRRTSRASCSWAPATATCRSGCPTWASAWSRDGAADLVGLGRDGRCRIRTCPPTCSRARPLRRKAICRTFSDCTTRPAQRPRLRLLSPRSRSTPRTRTRSSCDEAKAALRRERRPRAKPLPTATRALAVSVAVPGPLLHRRVRASTACRSSTTSSSRTWAGRAGRSPRATRTASSWSGLVFGCAGRGHRRPLRPAPR